MRVSWLFLSTQTFSPANSRQFIMHGNYMSLAKMRSIFIFMDFRSSTSRGVSSHLTGDFSVGWSFGETRLVRSPNAFRNCF